MPFGLFQHTTPTTRFDNAGELKAIALLMQQLRAKNTELALASKKYGPESKDQRKYEVVSRLVKLLEADITPFNNQPAANDPALETEQILALVKRMNNHVQTTLDKDCVVLDEPRNLERKYANESVQYGLIAAATIPAVVVPFTFPIGVAAIVLAKYSGDGIRDITGLNNLDPMSARIIKKLATHLNTTEINLTATVNNNHQAPQLSN